MKIVLLRHGKPNVPEYGKLKANEIHQWIDSYNSTGLMADYSPSQESIKIASSCNAVVCSDLLRSIESAQALGVQNIYGREQIFREMGLPYGRFPSPRLSPNIWAIVFRMLWFVGYSSNSESLGDAKLRAEKAEIRLKEIATENGSVLLVGHGLFNRFIAKQLLSNGWQGPANPGKQYWEFSVYEYTR